MLTREENELITKVGPGTPMGELFRRFWLPALLTSELESDGAPARIRLLCEDLVAFRDTTGRVGIIDAYCPHKQAPLFFGRNEDCGLRCVYHGWKFDTEGTCVDMPNEPPRTRFQDRIRQRAYPIREQGGVVWIYMGPSQHEPAELPQLEWVRAPEGFQHVTKWLQRSNWCQGMEGEIDSSHISFLHHQYENYNPSMFGLNLLADPVRTEAIKGDRSPLLTLEETPYGFTYGARRSAGDHGYLWRVTRWLFPFYSLIPGRLGTSGRAWVPIDDEHTWTFGYESKESVYGEAELANKNSGGFFPPRIERGTYQLKDGYLIDTWLPLANRENDYFIDRAMQKSVNFTGIWGVNEQDRSLQENMRPIVDRTKEHLGSTDMAVVVARRLLIKMARDLQEGIEPPIVSKADEYRLRAIDIVTHDDNFRDVLDHYHLSHGVARF